jgi:hypothetical protein
MSIGMGSTSTPPADIGDIATGVGQSLWWAVVDGDTRDAPSPITTPDDEDLNEEEIRTDVAWDELMSPSPSEADSPPSTPLAELQFDYTASSIAKSASPAPTSPPIPIPVVAPGQSGPAPTRADLPKQKPSFFQSLFSRRKETPSNAASASASASAAAAADSPSRLAAEMVKYTTDRITSKCVGLF